MTVDQRIEHIKAHHLCFNCLAPEHKTTDCRSHGRCRTCQQKHNSLVHPDQPPRPQPPSTMSTNAVANLPILSIQASLTMTSQVMLSGPSGNKLVVRALLDSGSTVSLISSKAANTLKLPKTTTHLTFSGVQDSHSSHSHSLVTVCLSPLPESQHEFNISAAVVPKVTCDLPLQGAEGVRDLPHLKGLQLTDPTIYLPDRIDLLLGENILTQLFVPPDISIGPEGTPSAWKTVFGWAIRGPHIPTPG